MVVATMAFPSRDATLAAQDRAASESGFPSYATTMRASVFMVSACSVHSWASSGQGPTGRGPSSATRARNARGERAVGDVPERDDRGPGCLDRPRQTIDLRRKRHEQRPGTEGSGGVRVV